ncbi:hypothetical protein Tco_0424146 [Tanacetum coccineum]
MIDHYVAFPSFRHCRGVTDWIYVCGVPLLPLSLLDSWPKRSLNIPLSSFFTRSIGEGVLVKFWDEEWLGTFKLADVYPRLYALESMKDCNISDRLLKLNGHISSAWNWRRSIQSMANAEHAPAMASPVRTDEQIVPRNRWVPIGKSNCYLNEEKSQPNPIFKIVVDILKQTNFFRAFTASSTIPAIYIQQFWDTIRFDSKAGSYKCQLDEQWFNLTQDTLKDALQITPVDNNRDFSSPPTPGTLVEFVNKLGYPKEVRHLSNVTTNDMFQPWRALTTIINLCLTGKTSGFERPRTPVLQILWGVVNQAHIDYAERLWEEFTQSIHTFTEDKRKLAQHTLGKKKATLLLIPIHANESKREVFGMTIPNELINNVIRGADYYDAYLEKIAMHQRYIAGEELSDPESLAPKPAKPIKQAKPKATKQPTISKTKAKKSKSAPAKPKEKKRKQLVDEFIEEGVPAAKPSLEDTEEAILQKVLQESLTDAYPTQRGPLPPVVFRETDTGKFQPLPEVPGKGKEKVGREDSTSLYAKLGLYGSDTESNEEMPLVVRSGAQDEGQAKDHTLHCMGSNPHDECEDFDKDKEGSGGNLRRKKESKGSLKPIKALSLCFGVLTDKPFTTTLVPSIPCFLRSKTSKNTINATTQPTTPPIRPPIECGLPVPELHYQLPHTPNESVKEVVISSVKHAMRAPLRARFKDLLTSYIKEILLQRMLEENYDKGHTEHRIAYEALQGSIHRDECEDFDEDKDQEETKKKGKQDSLKPPLGSPPSPPPPPLPPSGASGASGTTGASDSAQAPPPPPPSSSTHQGDQSTCTATPSSSKSALRGQ